MKLHGSILKQKKENALNCSDFCGSVDPFPYQGKSGHSFYDGKCGFGTPRPSSAQNNFAVQTEVIVTRSTRLKKNNRYQVHVVPSSEARIALGELHLLSPLDLAGAALLKKNACKKSFLRGVFLAGGSVSRPLSDYHLELITDRLDMGEYICKIMKGFDLPARVIDRKIPMLST